MAVLVGDCVELMRDLEPSSVDAVVCDPPYGLEFMGKEWDRLGDIRQIGDDTFKEVSGYAAKVRHGGTASYGGGIAASRAMQEWHHAWATEALRVLKPGGHLLAFGGTRTYHRLACAIEDAGFEIRDTICWLYGSGFPKSLDVSKAIDKAAGVEREVVGVSPHSANREAGAIWGGTDAEPERNLTAPATDDARTWQGWGTALKPAHEPIVVARKPLAGTVAGNVLEHGTGALNVDGCRVEGIAEAPGSTPPSNVNGQRGSMAGAMDRVEYDPSQGRWPANVVLDEEAAALLDEQTEGRLSVTGTYGKTEIGGEHRDGEVYGAMNRSLMSATKRSNTYANDSGGASRFFYCAKSSRSERNAGLEGFEEQRGEREQGIDRGARYCDDCGLTDNGSNDHSGCSGLLTVRALPLRRNTHPTVKPIALMRWLVRLVTPPGGLVLDPFTGSGTTGIAAGLEGFRFLGMEQDATYAAIASARIAWWAKHGEDALRIVAERERAESERAEITAAGQLELL